MPFRYNTVYLILEQIKPKRFNLITGFYQLFIETTMIKSYCLELLKMILHLKTLQ